MRLTAIAISLFLALISLECEATWDDAEVRGIIPYWQSGGDWFTLLAFVNGSEETSDMLHIRLYDGHSPCGDSCAVRAIRPQEMLTFSTTAAIPTWIPVTAGYGWILFRAQDGGFIHPYCVVYNRATGTGYVVPAYNQDDGF